MAFNKATKLTAGAIGIVAVLGGLYLAKDMIPKPATTQAVTLQQGYTAHFTEGQTGSYSVSASGGPSTLNGQCVTVEVIPWNAIGALIYANGGARTTANSLIAKYTHGACLNLVRQDDYGQMETHLSKGTDAFYVIMGDALDYVSLAQDKILPDGFEGVAVVGFSDGEDKCMLPAAAARDPQKARGAVVAAVPEDGDWNICVKWASDNGIPVNAGSTYDPAAINFVDTGVFTDADTKLVTHYCEMRELVKGGLDMGKKVRACVNGVATWTPGDVEVVQKYDGRAQDMDGQWQNYGLTGVASTHDYAGQMPALVVGRKDFDAQHPDLIVGIHKAVDQASQAINAGDLTQGGYRSNTALMQMAAYEAQVFNEQTADYWAKYFVGTVGSDALGNPVKLGGSRVIGLQQQADYFGLRGGTINVFKAVYDTFSGYDLKLRPDLTPKVIPYASIVNTQFLEQALQGIQLNTGATNVAFTRAAPVVSHVVSNRIWQIEFDSGKDSIRPASYATLNQLAGQAGMTGLHIHIDGYTDNTGSLLVNNHLSHARAQAVADFLHNIAPADFPTERMVADGHGPAKPIADNATAEGRQHNRRVEISFYN